jgi:hypothetical protein
MSAIPPIASLERTWPDVSNAPQDNQPATIFVGRLYLRAHVYQGAKGCTLLCEQPLCLGAIGRTTRKW